MTTCTLCKERPGHNVHGYVVCPQCLEGISLMNDTTILRHNADFKTDPQHQRTYLEEVTYRLEEGEKKYIKQRIKLLHISERLTTIMGLQR